MTTPSNDSSRILAIDGADPILALYRKIFELNQKDLEDKIMLQSLAGTLTGESDLDDLTGSSTVEEFTLSFASQGQDGVDMARKAMEDGTPYRVAFIDMRMPPGIDGLETAKLLRELDERICIIFVTAHSDRSLDEISEFSQDNVLYIQKPFNREEILLAARTMARSWINNNNKKLEAIFKAKSDFLATMSHELRTPLTSIIGNSEYLSEQLTNPEHLQILQSIYSAGKHQLALVNDILDISKIESGKFTIDETLYDLGQLLKDLQQMLSVNAQDAGIELFFSQKEEQTHQLLGDSQRIGQILINLLSNAIKFTEEGNVTLTTWSDDEHLFFELKDTGIGMTPDQVRKLFGRFEQADGTISRRFGGSGLGLYISLNLAQLMDGHIEASSTQGEGSTFLVTLPYQPSDQPILSSEEKAAGSVLTEKYTGEVMIAEDTPALMALERRSVEQIGATVTPAHNGQEAVELACSQHFDLILMDMQMPIMDGIEATRTLRSKGIDTPIIGVTANVMQEHREAFEEAGSNGFLAKPFHSEDLRKAIKPYLTTVQIEAEEIEAGLLNSAFNTGRRHQTGEPDEMINEEMMVLFHENLKGNRGELEQAYLDANWVQIREVSHVTKGYGIPFGYPEMTRLGTEVNNATKNEQQVPELVEELLTYLQEVLDDAAATSAPPSDTRRRHQTGETDEMVNEELLVLFYENLKGNRGELEQAYLAGDWVQIREVSHVTKGYGMPFGYPEMTRLGTEVNNATKNEQQVPELVEELLTYLQEVLDDA